MLLNSCLSQKSDKFADETALTLPGTVLEDPRQNPPDTQLCAYHHLGLYWVVLAGILGPLALCVRSQVYLSVLGLSVTS